MDAHPGKTRGSNRRFGASAMRRTAPSEGGAHRTGGRKLNGFAAISAQNGWAMVFTGAFIVMGGLSLLALIISQMHKVIAFCERRFGAGSS
jgi:hypothetical protein